MTHEGQQCARRVAHPPWFCPDHRDQAPAVGQVGFDGGVQRAVVEGRDVHGRLAPRTRDAAGPLQDALLADDTLLDDTLLDDAATEDSLPGI